MSSRAEPRLELRVERVVAGGDGLAHHPDGRVVFVPGTLPGEEVVVRSTAAKRDFVRAELVDVLRPSEHRRLAPCALVARGCGGCDWQHVDDAAQLALKVDILREALARTARLDVPVTAAGAVPPFAYRTTIRVAADRAGRAGFRRLRSNEVVRCDGCLVAHPALAELLDVVQVPTGGDVSLRVSVATGERTARVEATDAGRPVAPGSAGLGLPESVRIGDDATLVEHVHGVPFRVSAASFFQSGPDAAALLVATVGGMLDGAITPHVHVVDAYGGVGLFAATVAAGAARVTVVEGSATACADARHNLTGRPAEVVQSLVERWTPVAADVVIADPARAGLGRDGVDTLAATGATTMVLIGCDPVAFARDAGLLVAAGYRLADVRALDLFPQTHHVEVVGRFERTGPGR